MNMSRRGKPAEAEWWRGMERSTLRMDGGVFNIRFYDLSDHIGKKCPSCKRSLDTCGGCGKDLPISLARPPRSPADFMSIYKGVSILQEVKSAHSPNAYDVRWVKGHQVTSLLNARKSGGEGFFIFNLRANRGMRTYAVDVLAWYKMLQQIKTFYVPWEWMEENCAFHVWRNKGSKKDGIPPHFDHYLFLVQAHQYHTKRMNGIPVVKQETQWGDLQVEGVKKKFEVRIDMHSQNK